MKPLEWALAFLIACRVIFFAWSGADVEHTAAVAAQGPKGQCLDREGRHWVNCPAPTFDVAPKTRKVRRPKQSIINIDPPPDPDNTFDIVTYCEDKSRFLLQSADGKWHCLALTGAPR